MTEPALGKFEELPEWNWHAKLLDGEGVWVLQVSGVHRSIFLPTGLLDLLPLTAVPPNPPLGRMRLAMIEEPPGSGSGLFRLNVIDDSGGVIVAVPSKVAELFDVDNTVLPSKGALLLGDGATPASSALWRTLVPAFPADEGKTLVARVAEALGWALETPSGGSGQPCFSRDISSMTIPTRTTCFAHEPLITGTLTIQGDGTFLVH